MLPPLADQDTAVLVVPVTIAVNCCRPPAGSDAEVGEIDIAIAVGAVTVTLAEADLVLSAMLVAVTR
jgi:hypothetical protein